MDIRRYYERLPLGALTPDHYRLLRQIVDLQVAGVLNFDLVTQETVNMFRNQALEKPTIDDYEDPAEGF